MSSKTLDGKIKISINIPENLLKDLDSLRKDNSQTRSSWITHAILLKVSDEKDKKGKLSNLGRSFGLKNEVENNLKI